MTDIIVLESLAEFIKENTRELLLEKPGQHGQSESKELVPPAVFVGYMPPKNYLNDYDYDVPCILVGYTEGSDTDDDASLNIKITCCTYSAGNKNKDGDTDIDAKGFTELLYLMRKINTLLFTANVIKNQTVVRKPLRWGLYEEQLWPYWHGWITFTTSVDSINVNPDTIERILANQQSKYVSEIEIESGKE